MPAPVPIRIRYDNAGLLGTAASLVGKRRAFDRQHERDLSFLRGEMQRRQEQRQFNQQLDLKRQQLDLSRQQQAFGQVQAQPEKPRIIYGGPQLSDEQKQIQSFAKQANLSPTDASALDLAHQLGDRGTVQKIIQSARRGQPGGADTPRRQSKTAYLQTLSKTTGLPPEVQQSLAPLIDDEGTSFAQFRVAADQSLRNLQANDGLVSGDTLAKQAVKNTETRRRQLQGRLDKLRDRLISQGIDPNTGPQGSPAVDRFDFGTGFRDTPARDPDPTEVLLFQEYQRVQDELNQMQSSETPTVPGSSTPGSGGWSIERIG